MDILTLLKTGGAVVALGLAATYLLPRTAQVERSARVDAPPQAVLALAGSTAGFQRFNPYLTADPDLRITPFGPEAGVGAGFAFAGKDGKGTQTIARISADAVVYHIDLGALGQPVQTIRVVPEGAGSRVTWTVTNDTGLNPIFRVFGLFMGRMMGPIFETGLDNLDRAAA